ncbi:ABC transporter substrate-binding protein [Halobacillus sp. ACCC02827]|uniref:ABC transporter substrate-binding protein n=1 Tax=Halobacillus sp. ACCC02827 TaxID=3052090 RepID=UPI00256FB3BC|nr:ABC transporter substrate-binding protein [Halobacillus sp. ACCC02827]WJE16441.1 ABC transporter substrate-binding protein [Halobacillus sp. ACCC02827]
MKRTHWFMPFVIGMLLMFAVGCSDDSNETEQGADAGAEETTDQQGNSAEFPVTVTDGSGEEVTIEEEPETIVSLIPSNTEITFALGQGDKLIGVDTYSNYPEEANDIEKIGAQEMDVEKILSLDPDLALVTDFHQENNRDILDKFEESGIDVVVVDSAESFDAVYDHIELLGDVEGASEEADELVGDMQSSLEKIKEKAEAVEEKKRVWVEVAPSPDIYTTGTGTFMNEMLEAIHAENTAADQEGWVKMTEEEAVQKNPDVIITTYGYYVDNPEEQVLDRAGWAEVPAVKQEQVFDVNNDTVTRPGPRLIDGVETLGKLIYPEVFTE